MEVFGHIHKGKEHLVQKISQLDKRVEEEGLG